MSKEKQIEEMAKVIDAMEGGNAYTECFDNAFADADKIAKVLYNAGYRKQREGEWTKHLDEWDCEYAKCSCCGEELYDSSGEDTIDMFYKFCPNCGAKMKGGAE